MSLLWIVIVLLLVGALGGIPDYGRGPYYGAGWPAGGVLWLILVVLLLIALVR